MKSTLLTICLIVLSNQVICQNSTMAKAYYKKAIEAYENKDFEKSLDHIVSTKAELGGNTNADITYIEAKAHLELDLNNGRAKVLFNKFLNTAATLDERRDEVASILVDLETSDRYYANGNIVYHSYKDKEATLTSFLNDKGYKVLSIIHWGLPEYSMLEVQSTSGMLSGLRKTLNTQYSVYLYNGTATNRLIQTIHVYSLDDLREGGIASIQHGEKMDPIYGQREYISQWQVTYYELFIKNQVSVEFNSKIKTALIRQFDLDEINLYTKFHTHANVAYSLDESATLFKYRLTNSLKVKETSIYDETTNSFKFYSKGAAAEWMSQPRTTTALIAN